MTNQTLEALHHRMLDLWRDEQSKLDAERDETYRKWYAGRIDGIRLCIESLQAYSVSQLSTPAEQLKGTQDE